MRTVQGAKNNGDLRKSRGRSKTWDWVGELPRLTSETIKLAEDIRTMTKKAVKTSKEYIEAATADMDEVMRMYAESYGYEIQDKYEDNTLVERKFKKAGTLDEPPTSPGLSDYSTKYMEYSTEYMDSYADYLSD